MKILVCISKAPDTTSKIAFTEQNTKFDENGIQYIINPYDEWYALVRALEIKEAGNADVTIITENLYSVTTSYTGGTCSNNDGVIGLQLSSGGTSPYLYQLSDGSSINSSSLYVTFNSLTSGSYTYTVTDSNGCNQTGIVTLPISSNVNFSLFPTTCGSGDTGTITALITSGEPPFTFLWSDNVSLNPQDIYVSGLTGGTYTLTITDSNNCVQTRNTV